MSQNFDHPVAAGGANVPAIIGLVLGILSLLGAVFGSGISCFCSCAGGILGSPVAVVIIGGVVLLGVAGLILGLVGLRKAQSTNDTPALAYGALGTGAGGVFIGIVVGLLICLYYGLGIGMLAANELAAL